MLALGHREGEDRARDAASVVPVGVHVGPEMQGRIEARDVFAPHVGALAEVLDVDVHAAPRRITPEVKAPEVVHRLGHVVVDEHVVR